MSPVEIEKIGLAKQQAENQAGPAGGEAQVTADSPASEGPRPAATPTDSRPMRRVYPLLVIALVLALAGLGMALGNQLERADRLENRVAFLGEELDRAHSALAAHELKMEGVRSAVADLTSRMSALQTLVDEPSDDAQP